MTPRVLGAVLCLGLAAAACSGGGAPSAEPAAAKPRPTTTTTTAPAQTPEDAVREAYLRSWDDYARAVWTLDPSGLERTYADRGLAGVLDEVDDRVCERRLSRVEVTHDIQSIVVSGNHAAVTDNVVNWSVAVDADTGADLEVRHPEPVYWQMMLQKIDGSWKVVFYT